MPNNVLITGAPGIGKTTLIKRLMQDLMPVIIKGFYKETIYENGIIKGYRLITNGLHERILAHVYFEGPQKYNGFGINMDGLNYIVDHELRLDNGAELYILDEIGKMECLSDHFCNQVKKILDSETPLIASVAQINAPKLSDLRSRKDVTLVHLTEKNRDVLWKNILLKI